MGTFRYSQRTSKNKSHLILLQVLIQGGGMINGANTSVTEGMITGAFAKYLYNISAIHEQKLSGWRQIVEQLKQSGASGENDTTSLSSQIVFSLTSWCLYVARPYLSVNLAIWNLWDAILSHHNIDTPASPERRQHHCFQRDKTAVTPCLETADLKV